MKELTMFYLESCPYCKRARAYMKELLRENPAYCAIPFRKVEERLHRKEAEKYDYFYVPTFYIGDEKVSEGAIDKAGVREVLDQALQAQDAPPEDA